MNYNTQAYVEEKEARQWGPATNELTIDLKQKNQYILLQQLRI